MSKTIRVGNWWFWQGVFPFALNLDQVVVIDSGAVYLDLVDSGSFALTEEMRQALGNAMKEYQLWKLTRDRVPTAPPAYMQGDTQP